MDRSGLVLELIRCRFRLPPYRDFLLFGYSLVVPLGLGRARRWKLPEHLTVILTEPLHENPDGPPGARSDLIRSGLPFDSITVCVSQTLSKHLLESRGTHTGGEGHRDPLKEVKLVPRPVRPVSPIVQKIRQL